MNVYENIVQGLNEALEYEKGNFKAKVTVYSTATPILAFDSEEIKNIRNSLNMMQRMFADIISVSKKTVESWETGTNYKYVLTVWQRDNHNRIYSTQEVNVFSFTLSCLINSF